MRVLVHIMLKEGVLDPQGKAVMHALKSLGFLNVLNARQGKVIELDVDEQDKEKACQSVKNMCENLLANTIIEDYDIKVESAKNDF